MIVREKHLKITFAGSDDPRGGGISFFEVVDEDSAEVSIISKIL